MLAGKTVREFKIDDTEVIFRYPEMSDAKDLERLINSLIEEKAAITLDREQSFEEELSWLSETLKNVEKGKEIALVVEVDEKVLGSSGVRKKEGNESHVGELGILLRKGIRGKGIGEKLIKTLIKEAKKRLEIEIVTLNVYHTNEIALNLYKKAGFEEIGRLKDGAYHNDKYKDVIIMSKDLR